MADEAADTTPDPVVEPSAVVDPLPSSSSSTEPVAPPPPVEASAKKKGGRPNGAKDAKPRVRRPPVVRTEPIPKQQESRPVQEKRVVATVTQIAAEPELEVTPPPSPRTLYRETSRNLMALRGVMHENRRSSMEATVSQKLASWPLV